MDCKHLVGRDTLGSLSAVTLVIGLLLQGACPMRDAGS